MLQSSAYFPVCVDKLEPDKPVSFDLYIKSDNHFVLYSTRGHAFSQKDLTNLTSHGVHYLYAKGSEQEYFQYLEANLPSIVSNEWIDLETKAAIIYSVATNMAKAILEDPRSGDVIKRSKRVVESIVNLILLKKSAFLNLMRITSHDYSTYIHSVNVCTLAVALAKCMEVKAADDLSHIGLGALLHDLGKCYVDSSILNKAGPLDRREWEIVSKHPQWGVELAVAASRNAPENGDVILAPEPIVKGTAPPEESLVIIEQHHESCDGRGYPRGLTDKEIHPYAKIVRVVDIYDSITASRPYRKALSPYRALKLIQTEMINGIDKEIFLEFIFLLGYGTK